MNELKNIISKYFSKDNEAITYSNIDEIELNKMIQHMGGYERPDILSIYDNKIVAIEHFEFDSYKNTRKGSDYKIQDSIIEQKMQKKIDSDLAIEKEIYLHDEIKNNSDLKQYYSNFKKVLTSYIDNIQEYRNHIVDDFGNDKDIEFWFFAEDVSPLGSYYYRKNNINPSLLLPFSKENIDILRQHKEIKGIIFGIYAMKEYKLVIMYNDDETLDKIENNDYFKVKDSEFFSFNPQTTAFAILIPNDKVEVDNNE